MDNRTYSILIIIYLTALIAIFWIALEPFENTDFQGCDEAVEIPIVKASTFTYCEETDKTWKPYWNTWGEPGRFERERIEQRSK